MDRSLAEEGQFATAFTPLNNQGVTQHLLHCLRELKQGEILTTHENLERILVDEYSREESPLVCWTMLQMALALLEHKDRGLAIPWFQKAIAVAREYKLTHCVSMMEALVHIAKAWFAAAEARVRLKSTIAQLGDEIQALDGELYASMECLHQALTNTHFDEETIGIPAKSVNLSGGRFRETLHLRLLGIFDVVKEGGTRVSLCANRKGQMIFKLLVSKPWRRYHKETLLAKFWPSEDPDEAMGKLHVAISRLRRALAKADLGNAIVFEADTYSLCHGLRIESDLLRFDAHYRAGCMNLAADAQEAAVNNFEQALRQYRGAYLAEIVGEDWPIQERMRLEEQYLILLSHLARWRYDSGDYAEAIELCRKFLRLDDLREDIYRLLMRSLYRLGRRNQALRVYRDLVCLLDRELGVEPMLATQEMMVCIREESGL